METRDLFDSGRDTAGVWVVFYRQAKDLFVRFLKAVFKNVAGLKVGNNVGSVASPLAPSMPFS